MAQTAALLRVRHVPTAAEVAIPIFVSSFEMDAVPKWHAEEVFGRMDPIFTYKSTQRKFTAIMRTPHGGELVEDDAYNVWNDEITAWLLTVPQSKALNKGACKQFYETMWTSDEAVLGKAFGDGADDEGMRTADMDVVAGYLPLIADLYKLMYPSWVLGSSTFEDSRGSPTVRSSGAFYYGAGGMHGVGRMTGTPLLEIFLAGVATENIWGDGPVRSLIFVPETFKVTKLQTEDAPAVVINDFSDNRFAANADGYTITLGGTVLHRGAAPGFTFGADKLYFQQGRNFPFDTSDQSQFENPERDAASPPAPGAAPSTTGGGGGGGGSTP